MCSTGTWFHLGDFTEARNYAERALALYDPGHPTYWPFDPQIFALAFAFRSLMYLGLLDQARLRRHEALAHARQRAHAFTLAVLLAIALRCDAHIQSDPAILLQHAEEIAVHCAEQGLPYYAAVAKLVRGSSLSALGRTDEALPLLTEALTEFRATGAVTVVPAFLTALADTFGKAGRPGRRAKATRRGRAPNRGHGGALG